MPFSSLFPLLEHTFTHIMPLFNQIRRGVNLLLLPSSRSCSLLWARHKEEGIIQLVKRGNETAHDEQRENGTMGISGQKGIVILESTWYTETDKLTSVKGEKIGFWTGLSLFPPPLTLTVIMSVWFWSAWIESGENWCVTAHTSTYPHTTCFLFTEVDEDIVTWQMILSSPSSTMCWTGRMFQKRLSEWKAMRSQAGKKNKTNDRSILTWIHNESKRRLSGQKFDPRMTFAINWTPAARPFLSLHTCWQR
jgi:hypothetical protein